jgi:hypothetical protein
MLNLKKNLRLVKKQKRELRGKRAENRSHNLGKALGEGLGHNSRTDVLIYGRKDGNS